MYNLKYNIPRSENILKCNLSITIAIHLCLMKLEIASEYQAIEALGIKLDDFRASKTKSRWLKVRVIHYQKQNNIKPCPHENQRAPFPIGALGLSEPARHGSPTQWLHQRYCSRSRRHLVGYTLEVLLVSGKRHGESKRYSRCKETASWLLLGLWTRWRPISSAM